MAIKKLGMLILIVSLALAAAFPVNAAEPADLKQRIRRIKETYEISVEYKKSVEEQAPEYLDDLEKALEQLGPVFTKRLNRYFNTTGFAFRVEIVPFPEDTLNDRPWIDALFIFNSAARRGYEQTIELYVKPEKNLNPSVIVHEFGHAFHNGIGYGEFAKINGGKKSYSSNAEWDPSRYVSKYAMSDHYEDFAETFRCLVMENPDAQKHFLALSTTDQLYQKYHYIYEQIGEFLGSNSKITKKAAKFLGV